MFTSIIQFLKNLFGATEAVSKEVTQRDAEKNTPGMQSNAEGQQVQADKAQAAKDIADPKLANLEKDVAE